MTAAVPAPTIEFDAAAHLYRVGGVIIPSVTQILQDVGIVDYSFLTEQESEEAMARGRRVHQATHFDDQSDLDESSVRPEEMGFVEAWRNCCRETGFVPELIECQAFHPIFRYCGTPDRKGRIANRKGLAVMDIKTGSLPFWCRYQTAAYGAMEPRAILRFGAELHEDGTYRIEEYPVSNFQSDLAVFQAAALIYEVKRRAK